MDPDADVYISETLVTQDQQGLHIQKNLVHLRLHEYFTLFCMGNPLTFVGLYVCVCVIH